MVANSKIRDEGTLDVRDGYFPPFSEILEALAVDKLGSDDSTIQVSVRVLKFLLFKIASSVPFDADYYSENNEDLRQAVKAGTLKSLRDHFINVGFFEGREGAPLPVDRQWYLSNYQDVARAYSRGAVSDLSEHLNKTGRHEGRSGTALQASERSHWENAFQALKKSRADSQVRPR